VSVVRLQDKRAVSYEPFVTGWLNGDSAWGRPADVLAMPDGSLLISDDLAGAIYRVSYHGIR
jgi:glucose/arabinose dehydrogenase